MTRTDFQRLARFRLKEARYLLDAKFPNGAYYLAGYAVECALKACIAKNTKRFDFPVRDTRDIYTHHLLTLVNSAGLKHLHLEQKSTDAAFDSNWAVVKDWSEDSRYRQHSKKEATALVKAISDARHGVLQWIEQHW